MKFCEVDGWLMLVGVRYDAACGLTRRGYWDATQVHKGRPLLASVFLLNADFIIIWCSTLKVNAFNFVLIEVSAIKQHAIGACRVVWNIKVLCGVEFIGYSIKCYGLAWVR